MASRTWSTSSGYDGMDTGGEVNRRLAAVIAVVITVVWTISFTADLLNPQYSPPPTVHALMMLVAGAAFGGSVLGKRSNGK
jgi:hypothetical protein